MSELKCIWPVILTGECPKIISSPVQAVKNKLVGHTHRKYRLEKSCGAELIDQHSRVVMEKGVFIM